ncbi:hypothetical protein Poly59_22490 [Rubripirellula reticaptiva]|uniref:Uncharacterized protein n=1 Tax=Rubripirellula reticaptiva TaxID=2528013 RepID=A0A5C6F771_9BACT|nr:hypothetical protein Poly59_22490 [Rubripirellula reticaptiva]
MFAPAFVFYFLTGGCLILAHPKEFAYFAVAFLVVKLIRCL